MILSGRKLRRLRESKGWSPAKGAVEAGFSENYLLQLESGRRPITANALLRLRGWGYTAEELERELQMRSRKSA